MYVTEMYGWDTVANCLEAGGSSREGRYGGRSVGRFNAIEAHRACTYVCTYVADARVDARIYRVIHACTCVT